MMERKEGHNALRGEDAMPSAGAIQRSQQEKTMGSNARNVGSVSYGDTDDTDARKNSLPIKGRLSAE